ncbi:uncharacterized protein SCHCODRAFT_01110308 [Schizophyllum commune H4-8]|nr:uncharacterized protein SCHCODRAFT_01110308 [Schizophyllum commune H4-8]KAI5884800.1 hypothetical protein SCHCODRAFT_01110308 [Schizophyllum commune H4-8]
MGPVKSKMRSWIITTESLPAALGTTIARRKLPCGHLLGNVHTHGCGRDNRRPGLPCTWTNVVSSSEKLQLDENIILRSAIIGKDMTSGLAVFALDRDGGDVECWTGRADLASYALKEPLKCDRTTMTMAVGRPDPDAAGAIAQHGCTGVLPAVSDGQTDAPGAPYNEGKGTHAMARTVVNGTDSEKEPTVIALVVPATMHRALWDARRAMYLM